MNSLWIYYRMAMQVQPVVFYNWATVLSCDRFDVIYFR